jgi:ABC-type transporter Mla maintaining outer membrane lipid asymmetry ATPase subunit MlaF
MAELLRLEGISLEGGDGRRVFRDLNWSLPPGGRARLHAPSGAGSSALLRLCAGLADPQEGRVILDGVSLSTHAFTHPFLREGGIGWVPREKGLLDNLSLLANVALPLRFLRGHPRLRAEELAREWLETSGLSARAQYRPHDLEPRERWLGALVRAAAIAPRLWLLDRPPSGLDQQGRAHASQILRKAAAKPETAFVIAGDADGGEIATVDFQIESGQLVRRETP